MILKIFNDMISYRKGFKMKFKTVFTKAFAVVMALAMMLGVCAPSILAATETVATDRADRNGDGEINYVSFGDSMTNGYGLDGYNGNSGVFDYGYTSYANQFAAFLAGVDFDEWVAGGYEGEGLVFEGPNGKVNHHQLAMSGCRAEDLHWLLEFDFSNEAMGLVNVGSATQGSGFGWREFASTYEDFWYETFSAGDMRTFTDLCNCDDRCTTAATYILASGYKSPYSTKAQREAAKTVLNGGDPEFATWGNHVPIVAEYYQSAVKKADVISLALGNTNFGTFIFNEIYNSVNGDDKPLYFKVERAIEELSPEMQANILDLRDELYTVMEDYLGEDLSYEIPEDRNEISVMDALANTLVYGFISYYINYAGTVEAILALNPDVEIIQVGLMNAYAGDSDVEIEGATIGDLLGVLYPVVNAYLAALPTVMQAKGEELYSNATFYYAEVASVACMVEVYGNDFYFDEEGNSVIYDEKDNYEQGTLTCNRNSLTRKRFFSDVMGTVRKMHGNSFNGITLDYSITLEDVLKYEEMTLQDQANYAAANSAKALTIAVYLAYEEAHIIAGKEAPVTLEAVMGLGDIKRPEKVEPTLMALLKENAPAFAVTAATAISGRLNTLVNNSNTGFKAATNYGDILAVYTGAKTAYDVGLAIAQDDINKDIVEYLAKEGVEQMTDSDYEYYYNQYAAAYGLSMEWSQFKAVGEGYNTFVEYVKTTITAEPTEQIYEDAYTQYAAANGLSMEWSQFKAVGEGYNTFIANVKAGAIKITHDEAAKTLEPYVQKAADNVASLCTLLALTDAFTYALVDDPTSNSLLCLNARTQIGTGLGGHPSPAGHDDLFEAVKDAYVNEHTAQAETIENMITVIEALAKYVYENREAIYAEAYQYAEENGIIEKLNLYITEAEYYVGEAYAWYLENEDEIEAEARKAINAAIEEAKRLLAELRVVVNEQLNRLEAQVEKQIDILLGQINKQIETLQKLIVDTAKQINDYVYAQALALQAQIKHQIEVFEAQVRHQIAVVKAYIEAKIAALEAAVEAKIKALKDFAYAQLDAFGDLVGEDFETFEEAILYIDKTSGDYLESIIANIGALLEAATNYYYTRTADSFYAAIGGEGYAELVADALGVGFESLEGLRASDIIAILDATYENDAYGNALLANNADLAAKYVSAVKKADIITLDLGHADLIGFVADQMTGMLLDTYGDIIKDLVSNGILAGAPTSGAFEMDWTRFADFITTEDVENVKTAVKAALVEAGLPETYTYNFEINQEIGGNTFTATYPVELYPVDFAMVAVESYLYAAANYVYNYSAAIEAINAANPDAQILVIGAVNPFAELDVTVEGIELSEVFAALTESMDAQALAGALTLPNTTYVSVKGAEATVDTSALIDVKTLSVNANAFGATEAGNAYIAEKILEALTLDCTHAYDNACDAICNICNAERTAADHVYTDACDTTCNVCGATREVGAHTFGEWKVVTEPTTEAEGLKERVCTECGFKETETIAKLDKPSDPPVDPKPPVDPQPPVDPELDPEPEGLPAGAVVAIVISSTLVAGAGGFAIFWFVIKKKTFADLVSIFKK